MKILIVEDNHEMVANMTAYLTKEGHVCEAAYNLAEADEKMGIYEYDMILLDIMLPDGNGLHFLRDLKKQRLSNAGVLVISAKNAVSDKIDGLDYGADDYVTKPFHMSELNARIKSIYRRKHFDGDQTIQFNEITVNPETQEVFVHGEQIILTRKEFELLVFFLANKNRVLTKQSIAEHLWGDHMDYMDSFDFIYQHIKNLRKKLSNAGADDYMSNIYGMGYKFKSSVS